MMEESHLFQAAFQQHRRFKGESSLDQKSSSA
jgi:hypothetical protein